MTGFLNILSDFLHKSKIIYLKIFFTQGLNIETTNHVLIKKFVIYKFNQYKVFNAKD